MLKKIKEIAIKAFTGIAAVAAAVFYVLFKQSKNRYNDEKLSQLEKENEELRQRNEAAGVIVNAAQEAQLAELEERKRNEEIKSKVAAGNSIKQHNALLDGLRK